MSDMDLVDSGSFGTLSEFDVSIDTSTFRRIDQDSHYCTTLLIRCCVGVWCVFHSVGGGGRGGRGMVRVLLFPFLPMLVSGFYFFISFSEILAYFWLLCNLR